jgi:endonuclease-3
MMLAASKTRFLFTLMKRARSKSSAPHTGGAAKSAATRASREPVAGSAAASVAPRAARAPVALSYEEQPATDGGGGGGGGGAALPASPQPGAPRGGWGAPAPPHPCWREQLARIKAARAANPPAPVDTMGCERCADPSAPPATRRFQTLVSLMLSSQTKDEVNFAACQRLLSLPGGFTAAAVAAAPLAQLEALLHPVGFYRNKAKFLQAAAAHCAGALGGDIPATVEALCELKGVGPKMAFICMSAAWSKNVGIGVDVHVHRIAKCAPPPPLPFPLPVRTNREKSTQKPQPHLPYSRLGWVKTEEPRATQAHLQAWLPREEWDPLNVLLVGWGQTVCAAVKPRCEGCPVRSVCPTGAGKAASLRGGQGAVK